MNKKVYSSAAIRIGTLLGGPAVGGYMISKNYKRFKEKSAARATFIIGLLLTLLILLPFCLVPTTMTVKLPGYVIPLLYTIIAHLFVERYQGTKIKSYLDNGGSIESNFKAAVLGLLGLVSLIFCVLIMVALIELFQKQ